MKTTDYLDNNTRELSVKGSDGTIRYELTLANLKEITLAGLCQDTDLKELRNRAGHAAWLHTLLTKVNERKEMIVQAFEIWALNMWQIGWAIKERGISNYREVQDEIKRAPFDEARRLARIDKEAVEDWISARSSDVRKLSKGKLLQYAQGKTSPKPPPPQHRALVALNYFLDMMHDEQAYYLSGSYQEHVSYKQRIENAANRQIYRSIVNKFSREWDF
jgi:hypothetical protein